MLVVKSCVEFLRSCGINILVVVSEIPVFCLDYKLYLLLKTFEHATLGAFVRESGIQVTVCLSTVNQERIATWKEVAVL